MAIISPGSTGPRRRSAPSSWSVYCTGWRPDRPPRGAIYFPIWDAWTVESTTVKLMIDRLLWSDRLASVAPRLRLYYASAGRVRSIDVVGSRAAPATYKHDARLTQWRLHPLIQQQINNSCKLYLSNWNVDTTFCKTWLYVWNSSPANLRSASVSLHTFAGRLQITLFELPSAQLRTVYSAL